MKLNDYTKEPTFFIVHNSVQDYRVSKYGGEFTYTGEILSRLESDDILFDIGACVGVISILAAKKGVTVISFEPDPSFRKHLIQNINENNLDIKIIDWAVSNKSGQSEFYTDGAFGNSPSLRESGDRGKIIVQTKSIDSCVGSEIPFPDAIKLDIEGAEILAVTGMKNLLKSENAPKYIFIETHPEFLPQFGSSESEVIELITDVGYTVDYKNKRSDQTHWIFKKSN